MINELTANAPLHDDILNGLQWYFVPNVNPDGYEYTWNFDRGWRKNRRKNSDGLCYGVDLNRNWNDHFTGDGSSQYSCSDNYRGEFSFSEPETVNIANYMLNHEEIVFFNDVHCYGQLLMLPYAWTNQSKPANFDELMTLCEDGNDALHASHGKNYTCGAISDVIYVASGSSVDWIYDVAGIKYAFGFELRPGDGDEFVDPMDPPETEIIPTAEEIFAWHEVVAMSMINAQAPRP